MSWRPQLKALLCALLLLATLATIAIKTLTPVTANNGSVVSVRPNIASKAKRYPGLDTSFEFESHWDKGAFWDDEAPAYDLSQTTLGGLPSELGP